MWELLDGDDSAGIKDSELCQRCARTDLESQDREEEVNQVERALLQELYRKKAVREASAKDDFGYWACAEWLEAFKKRSLAPSGKTPPALWDDINDKLRCPHADGFKAGTKKKLLSPELWRQLRATWTKDCTEFNTETEVCLICATEQQAAENTKDLVQERNQELVSGAPLLLGKRSRAAFPVKERAPSPGTYYLATHAWCSLLRECIDNGLLLLSLFIYLSISLSFSLSLFLSCSLARTLSISLSISLSLFALLRDEQSNSNQSNRPGSGDGGARVCLSPAVLSWSAPVSAVASRAFSARHATGGDGVDGLSPTPPPAPPFFPPLI
jgi:protein-arginine kinase activator protein McsA